MNNRITSLFNMGRRNPFGFIGRRRNNRGMMWGSLIGLGVGAAAYGLSRNRNFHPLQNLMNNSRMGTGPTPNMNGFAEFAKELVPNRNPLNNK